VEEWAAARECQLELACDDFFLECEPLNIRFNGCEARINAERNGSCTAAAEGCAIPGTHYRANEQDLAGGCLPFLLDNILFHKNVLRNDGTPSASYALLDQKVSVGRANLAPHEPVLRNRFARGFSVTSLTTFRVTSSIVGASVKEASWDAYS